MRVKTAGLLVAGTTGEGPTLSKSEKNKLLKIAVKEAHNKAAVIMNIGTNNTLQSIENAREAKQLGADAGLAIVPYYNKPCFEGCIAHFEALGKANIPIIAYHHPGRTGITLNQKTFDEIGNQKHIIGIKECNKMNSSHPVFCGNDEDALEALLNGAEGTISVIGNIIPLEWKEFVAAPSKAKAEKFKELIRVLSLEVNPKTIKYAMSKRGFGTAKLRLPLVEAKVQTKKEIDQILDSFFKNDET